EFLLIEGEVFRTLVLDYSGGPRYLDLVRDPTKPDLLADILKPAAGRSKTEPTAGADTNAAPVGPPRHYVCYQTAVPIQIDGRLDDEAWAQAPWTDDFVDILGPTGATPRFRTRARMLWDNTYFYVGALLEEPHVWGTLTQHDSVIFKDNDFEIFIDPD